ncbi:MAG: diphthamide synthesis protein [Candidatus Woesearchaeota archaeon]
MMVQKTYDLEIDRVIHVIRKNGYERVCLQFPDGLKPDAKEFSDRISSETGAEVIIWAGSNFGACDLSLDVKRLGIDLLVHVGHSKWVFDDAMFPLHKRDFDRVLSLSGFGDDDFE